MLNRDGTVTEFRALNPANYGAQRPQQKDKKKAQARLHTTPKEKTPTSQPRQQAAPKKPSYAATAAAPAPAPPASGWKKVTGKKEMAQEAAAMATAKLFTKRKGTVPFVDRQIALDRQSREGGNPAPNQLQLGRITSAINIALYKAKAPAHVRIKTARCSAKGNLTATATPGGDAKMLLHFREMILQAARKHDNDVVDVRSNENWPRLKVMVPVAPYCEREGLDNLKEVIEAENEGDRDHH